MSPAKGRSTKALSRPGRQRPAPDATQRGSMTIEVAFLMVLLVVPLFYLVGTLGRLQAGAYAVTAAAREAGRTFATAQTPAEAPGRAQVAANLVLSAHGFNAGQANVAVTCPAGACLSPGSTVQADAALDVPVPLIPDFAAAVVPTTIRMTARHTEPVDEFKEG